MLKELMRLPITLILIYLSTIICYDRFVACDSGYRVVSQNKNVGELSKDIKMENHPS